MMTVIVRCDKCGKEILAHNSRSNLTIMRGGIIQSGQEIRSEYDLCPKCADEIEKAIKGAV